MRHATFADMIQELGNMTAHKHDILRHVSGAILQALHLSKNEQVPCRSHTDARPQIQAASFPGMSPPRPG